MRDNLTNTFIARSLNCQFRLLKVEHKSGDRERRTPGYEEVMIDGSPCDCYGVWEPVANVMIQDAMGRLINIERRLYAQMLEIAPEHPEINDRLRICAPSDMSGYLFTIHNAERYAEQYWSMLLEKYKD